jgi:hypothetical protein
MFKPNSTPLDQKLFASARIFHMADLGFTVYLNVGDKPVRP